MTTRKSFSANRSKNANESSSDTSSDFGNRTFKVSSSASYESSRRKVMKDKNITYSPTEDFSPRYFTLHSKEDQSIFLNATQTLEKLNKIITQNSTNVTEKSFEFEASQFKSSSREIILYRNKLKKLMEERCTLILKEECHACVKKTTKLINDFKVLFTKEKLKFAMMPLQACNRFISSTDISTSALQFLLKKLQKICDLQASVRGSYHKFINLFHVNLDLSLYQMVQKTIDILSKLNCSLFYWAHKSMQLFMQRLCLADPNSVSPEFLLTILDSCQVFNLLINDNFVSKQKFNQSHNFFFDYVKSYECKELPFSSVLGYLAFFEAKIASEKIVHSLTLTCRKSRQVSLKRSKSTDIILKTPKLESNTSDYFSDLDLEISRSKEHLVKNSDFANVLTSIIQRNQSLVLKYLYVISDLQNSKGLSKVRRPSSYDSSASYPVRQTWSVPEQSPRDDNRIIFEEMYWSTFWNHVQKFILKILFEVPYHQYGDTTAGTIILWPESFLHTLYESLKLAIANKEITLEGRQVMKNIYDTIFVQKMQILWDKEFSLAISATHSHLCVPVPITSNKVKTHPGNLLYSCLEVGINSLQTAVHSSNSSLLLKSFHNLQSTLDCFILWLNNKTRATASSYNFATYLLITRSDCSSSLELLKMKVMPLVSNEDLTNAYLKVSSSKHLLQKSIIKQIDIISGYETEVPNAIYNLLFNIMKDGMTSALRSQKSWILCSVFSHTPVSIDIQEELIFLLSEVITGLHNSSSVVTAITSAFAEASIYSLKNAKTNTSLNDVLLINSELSKHLQWIDELNISEVEKYNIKELACLRKLNSILKYIQKLSSQRHTCLKHRNRVSPSNLPEVLLEGGLLSDQEKQLWQTRCSKSWFCFCL